MTTQKGVAPILLILLGLIVIGASTYFYMMNKENSEDTTEHSSEFKIYTNTNFGFSINIPSDMNVSENSKGSEPTILFQNSQTFFLIRKYEIGKYGDSIDEVYQRKTSGLYPKTEINLNDKRVLQYSLPAFGEGGEFFPDQTILIIENEGYVYQIEFHKKELEKIDLDILSSFNFSEAKDVSHKNDTFFDLNEVSIENIAGFSFRTDDPNILHPFTIELVQKRNEISNDLLIDQFLKVFFKNENEIILEQER